MIHFPATKGWGITAVYNLPDPDPILDVIARLALCGPVQVIVGGNRFDAHRLSRIMRRHTVDLDQTLLRIAQARPFTCAQAVTLLANTRAAAPLVAIDLLTTFYDDGVTDADAVRLVQAAVAHLQRLGAAVPVLVTLRSSTIRPFLAQIVTAAADHVLSYQSPACMVQPPLF